MNDDDSVYIGRFYLNFFNAGLSYTVYVGSNGYITFGHSDTTYFPSFAAHFSKRRFAPLFVDLNPTASPRGSIHVYQDNEKVIVTWYRLVNWNTNTENTFQAIVWSNGTLESRYVRICFVNTSLEKRFTHTAIRFQVRHHFKPGELHCWCLSWIHAG